MGVKFLHNKCMAPKVLVATAHGTDNPNGRAIISSIVEQVARQLSEVKVVETYVDVQYPQIGEVLSALDPEDSAVVVPLLLSTGYHTRHDISGAAKERQDSGAPTTSTTTLGPHPLLAQIQADRILAQSTEPTHVVLVAAGSSDSQAQEDVSRQADLLHAELESLLGASAPPVTCAFLSAATPDVAQALSDVPQDERERVVLNSYLLAPGFFQKKLQRIVDSTGDFDGGLFVTEPLNDDARIAQIIVERFTTGA